MKSHRHILILATIVLSFVLAGCGGRAIGSGDNRPPEAPLEEPTERSVKNDEQEEVVRLVEDFGKKLKLVSLLAPQEEVKQSMRENYSGLVAPALLAEWQGNWQDVPGRLSSSPWPECIRIISVERLTDTGYAIKGHIVEMASSGAVGSRPITIVVDRVEDRWLITAVQLGSYGESGSNVYKNTEYGFSLSLPESWRGYSVIVDKWEGHASGGSEVVEKGPLISLRHPLWTDQNQRQDIPIMIFTHRQWNALQNGEFHVGAAPIGPSELGRSSSHVFALPARYNYAFPAGYEEVEEILKGNPLRPEWE